MSDKCISPDNPFDNIECPVEWAFGHGLSYTTFSYSDPHLSSPIITEDDVLEVAFNVTNTGPTAGKEAILLFLVDYARRVTPEKKLLKRFAKTPLLQPGESFIFTITIRPRDDLSFYGVADGANSRSMMESGLFYIGLGPKVDCRAHPEACTNFTLSLTDKYSPICETACQVWDKARLSCSREALASLVGPARAFVGRGGPAGSDCQTRCLKEGDWDWNYVSCLEKQVWSGSCRMGHHCRSWPMEEEEEEEDRSPNHGKGEARGGHRDRGVHTRGAVPTSVRVPAPSTLDTTPLQSPWIPFLGGTVCGVLGVVGFLVLTGRASQRGALRRGRATTPVTGLPRDLLP